MQPLDENLIDYWKLGVDGGIILASVVDGSPAARAGLKPADILVAMEGEPLHVTRNEQLAEFRRRVERMGVGRSVGLTYLRAGERRDISIPLDEAPKTAWTVDEVEDEALGLTVREITMDDILGQNLEGGVTGVVVSEMERAGPAHLAGLLSGDIIQSVDRNPVTDLASWRGEADRVREEKPEAILLLVRRRTETLFLRLRASQGSEPPFGPSPDR
jgi:S1-C subfamily serine protease